MGPVSPSHSGDVADPLQVLSGAYASRSKRISPSPSMRTSVLRIMTITLIVISRTTGILWMQQERRRRQPLWRVTPSSPVPIPKSLRLSMGNGTNFLARERSSRSTISPSLRMLLHSHTTTLLTAVQISSLFAVPVYWSSRVCAIRIGGESQVMEY